MKKLIVLLITTLFFCTFAYANSDYRSLTAGISPAIAIQKYKDVSINLKAISKLKNAEKKLSQTDKDILKKYIMGAVRGEDTFLLINCNLRDNLGSYIPAKEITKPLKYRLDYYAEQLYLVLSKSKLPQNMILYFGVDERELNALFKGKNISEITRYTVTDESTEKFNSLIKGYKYTDKGFITASYNKNYIYKSKYRFVINAPKNLQAVLIDNICPNSQKQILINKGYKWEIIDVNKEYDKDKKDYFYNIKLKMLLN